jgi:zinc protease
MTSNTNPLRLEYGFDLEGMRVVRQPVPVGAASFSATFVGPAGSGFDAAGQEGIAHLVNQLLPIAAGRHRRVELARRLDRAGATLSHQTSPESGEVTIWGPGEDWKRLLALLAEVVRTPRFDSEDIARVRRQLLERQMRERTQPASRAELELQLAVFPRGHPYRATGLGDRRSVARLTRSQLMAFHHAHYTSGGSLLIVTTGASLPAVEAAASAHFTGFPVVQGPELRLPRLGKGEPLERIIPLPGRSQVEIRLGGPSISQGVPEYAAAFLANEVLGGRPLLARLFQRVREKSGLAYHASSHLDTMRCGGMWTARAGTGADRWRRVVPMLAQEVARLRRETVPLRELNSIRRSAIGEIPLALESTSDAHELAVDVSYHRLPADYLLRWPAQLRAVRPDDVRRAAATAFDRNRSVTVITGPVESS